jgi:hypothetical protein
MDLSLNITSGHAKPAMTTGSVLNPTWPGYITHVVHPGIPIGQMPAVFGVVCLTNPLRGHLVVQLTNTAMTPTTSNQ